MINLFVNPFVCDDPARRREYSECIKRNVENPLIDKVVFVRENFKATYNDFFHATRNYPEDINIIANLDIYFDQSIANVEQINKSECYALTRWNKKGNDFELFLEHGMWSQDVWVFRGVVNERINANFNLGVWGCDNHVAYILSKFYRLRNPCYKIRCFHLHESETRPADRLRVGNRGTYKFVTPEK